MKTAGAFVRTRDQIKDSIRNQLSPRHVPAHIIEVKDIPYTLNGKKMELVVRDIVCQLKVGNLSSVANPECLEEYAQYAKLGMGSSSARL